MFIHKPYDIPNLTRETLPTGRTYRTPDDNFYPSVTTVLGAQPKDGLDEWRKRIGDKEADRILSHAGIRGTALHDSLEKYVDNDPDYLKGLMPHVKGGVLGIKEILDERLGVVYAQEQSLYSDHLMMAGMVDLVAQFDGKNSIVDFKTSLKPKKIEWISNYFIQETAYSIMWEERTGMPITQLVTIMDCDFGPTKVYIEHRDSWVKGLFEAKALYDLQQKEKGL